MTQIVAVEMIDLPLSDSEGAIENELKNKDGKFWYKPFIILLGVSMLINLLNMIIYAEESLQECKLEIVLVELLFSV